MSTDTLTLQAILAESARAARSISSRRGVLPRISDALDPLTWAILSAAAPQPARGSQLASAALARPDLRVSADQAYAWACQLASPRVTRHPLLKSSQVSLPDPPPSMWDAEFSITETGKNVLSGLIPNCLVNGIDSGESKMPPISVPSLLKALSALADTPQDAILESHLSELDFATPCVVELAGHENWSHSGRGWLSLNAAVECSSNTVTLSMIPLAWSHEAALEKVMGVVEDVPGVKTCSVIKSRTGTGFEIEVLCRNEPAAASATEALLASAPLKVRQKVNYMVAGPEGGRSATTPVEILRGFASSLVERGHSGPDVANALSKLDPTLRCVKKRGDQSSALGPYVIWAIDASGRNRTMPLTSLRRQSPGGRGAALGSEQVKMTICARTRSRAAILGFFGSSSSVEVRPPDAHLEWCHPAETLPQGASSPTSLVVPGEKPYIVIATSLGMVKKMSTASLCSGRRGTKQAIKLESGDVPVAAVGCGEDDDILLVTASGQAIRFPSSKLRESGPSSRGVAGMKLKDGDMVVSVLAITPGDSDFVAFSSTGTACRTRTSMVPQQNRAGSGVKVFSPEDPAKLVSALLIKETDELLVATTNCFGLRFLASDLSISETGSEFRTVVEPQGTASVVTACVIPPEGERLADPSSSPTTENSGDSNHLGNSIDPPEQNPDSNE